MTPFLDKTESTDKSSFSKWQRTVHEIIFEADTRAGKTFDILLIALIILSVITVMLESINSIQAEYGTMLTRLEWGFTIFFTIEYFLRLISIGHPTKYARSFFGVVDLLAILPTYLSLFFPGTHMLMMIRLLRVLRIFRVLKLVQYLSEAQLLITALNASRKKITVFLTSVVTIVAIFGSIMYLVEGEQHGFTSIPKSIYWAVVTLTTVGYGDIAPQTAMGQLLASCIMIMGYAIIAVPTGIVSIELSKAEREKEITTQCCPQCSLEGHDKDAIFCKYCGEKI